MTISRQAGGHVQSRIAQQQDMGAMRTGLALEQAEFVTTQRQIGLVNQ